MAAQYSTVRWNTRAGYIGWHWSENWGHIVWGLDELGEGRSFSVQPVGKGRWAFVSPDGDLHNTMRDVLAKFRLRMSDVERQTDLLEHMRTVLTLIANEVHATDLHGFIVRAFGGNRLFMEHYVHWLEYERLVKFSAASVSAMELQMEGHAILRMLNMTAADSGIDNSPQVAMERYRAAHCSDKRRWGK